MRRTWYDISHKLADDLCNELGGQVFRKIGGVIDISNRVIVDFSRGVFDKDNGDWVKLETDEESEKFKNDTINYYKNIVRYNIRLSIDCNYQNNATYETIPINCTYSDALIELSKVMNTLNKGEFIMITENKYTNANVVSDVYLSKIY